MVKKRNVALVILFTLITFGIYGIYWLVSTTLELKELGAKNTPNPWILLALLVPFVNFFVILYYYWQYSQSIEEVSKGTVTGWVLFILWIVFAPASIIWAQIELNKHVK